jgi:HD-like signal output (HDOD) protein
MRSRFEALCAADQRHLIGVARLLEKAGAPDEVVCAGLLHDIGKAMPGMHVTLPSRGAWVILRRLLPRAAATLAMRTDPPRACGGMWVLARHAEHGASLLADAGYPERVCWLVAHHERPDIDDPGLCALIAADDREPGLARGRM